MKHYSISAAGPSVMLVAASVDWRFKLVKRAFDIAVCVMLLPLLIMVAGGLIVINPLFNRGSLFYVQMRMGQYCTPFTVLKFRTMCAAGKTSRGFDDPLDHERITRLGSLLRRSRLDELPQIINVLKGEMSLIGPRPDDYEHARSYLTLVPGYAARHTVLPGISGYAQVELGYIDQLDDVRQKVEADMIYIRAASFRFECWIVFRTLMSVLRMEGR